MDHSTAPRPQRASKPGSSPADRRGFFVKLAATLIGGITGLVPLVSGLLVFLDPLRRKSEANGLIRVTTLDAVPDDDIPRYFPVIADRTDAWNRYPNEPVGAVFLRRRKGTNDVYAHNVICPHAGCFVDFNIDQRKFKCPCHNSSFTPDGARIDPKHCPSPRDLDALEVDPEGLRQGEVRVAFKNFRTATPEKIEEG